MGPWSIQYIQRNRLADFGCGPGHWTTRFAECGASVMGIDLSERSIRYAEDIAKSRKLNIQYLNQDYLKFSTRRQFDLITMISGDFSVLSPGQRVSLLGTFRSLLRDGGSVLLDVASIQVYQETTEKSEEYSLSSGYWSSRPHRVCSRTFKYPGRSLICEKYSIVGKGKQFEIFNWNQCYSIESLNALFLENGLEISEYYSDVAGSPYKDDSTKIAVVASLR